ncbi:hypothetical protein CS542_07140 [Pedobacter sp. IW39]|nr:hypothetical protein CS542_07140 [Pedobacter sp. IW39]
MLAASNLFLDNSLPPVASVGPYILISLLLCAIHCFEKACTCSGLQRFSMANTLSTPATANRITFQNIRNAQVNMGGQSVKYRNYWLRFLKSVLLVLSART